MGTSAEIKQKAIALAEKTDVNSITPKEVGGIMYDLASHGENVLRNGGTLGIRKVYESVAAMEADSTNPKDFWGDPIKKGNLVVIYDGTTTGVDNNKIYAFMKPGWELATKLDAAYATKAETDAKLSELGQEVDKKVDKEEGKVLIDNNLNKKLSSLEFVSDDINLTSDFRIEGYDLSGFSFTKESDGIHLEKTTGNGADGGAWCFINFLLNNGVYWKKNHNYYVSFEMTTLKDSVGGGFNIVAKYDMPTPVGEFYVNKYSILGDRHRYAGALPIDKPSIDEHPDSNMLFFQLGLYGKNDEFEGILHNLYIVDLGEIGTKDYIEWADFDKIVSEKGFIESASMVKESYHAVVADGLSKKDIEMWGDSLTLMFPSRSLEEKTGRNVSVFGYGGMSSTYIRDLFLNNADKTKTQIIWVGRNNYAETDVVIDDIRDMVSTLEHNDFIIMCPPNGQWGSFGTNGEDGTGEMKGGDSYKNFLEIERRLQAEYPSNFLNIRKAIIEGWRMGNVKLLSDFVQPSVGDNVTIEVSDATFLTTYNSSDVTAFGENFMSKIRIGLNGKYDVYKVIEKVDNTHLTVKLEEINRISSGNTVGNIVDSGGTDSIKYLRCMQNADYMCWLYDTTLSTFRKDGIHMTEEGLELVVQIVSRKLSSIPS